MTPTIPKTLEQQILALLPDELATKLLEIQREKNRDFNEMLEKVVKFYIEMHELDKFYSFNMISKYDQIKRLIPIDDFEL